jgi:hypothetical protein
MVNIVNISLPRRLINFNEGYILLGGISYPEDKKQAAVFIGQEPEVKKLHMDMLQKLEKENGVVHED